MGKRSKPYKARAVDKTKWALVVPGSLTESGVDEIVLRTTLKKEAVAICALMGGKGSLAIGKIMEDGKVYR